MPNKKLHIALLAFNPQLAAVTTNLQQILAQVAKYEQTADLIVLPPYALSGYLLGDLLYQRQLLASIEKASLQLAETVKTPLLFSSYMFCQHSKQVQNKVLLGDKQLQIIARQQNLGSNQAFNEKDYLHPGLADAAQAEVFTLKGQRIMATMAADLNANLPANLHALELDLIISLNNAPFYAQYQQQRQRALQKIARDANCQVAELNLCGLEEQLLFDGSTFLIAADGTVLATTSQLDFVTINNLPNKADAAAKPALKAKPNQRTQQNSPSDNWRQNQLLFSLGQKDCQAAPPQHSPPATAFCTEARLYKALMLAIRDYVHDSGFKKVLLGSSGGVDSALVLALAADALGGENVQSLMMPYKYTATISIEDAAELAQNFAVNHQLLPINTLFSAFEQQLSQLPMAKLSALSQQNLQARIRGLLLMSVSNNSAALVLNTSNKSETMVGYSTLHGDMVGGFAPLKDIYKTDVYKLCHFRNAVQKLIPQRILERPPSAELAPAQLDSDSLPDYAALDLILPQLAQGYSLQKIVAQGFAPAAVLQTSKLQNGSEYKRRVAANGVLLSEISLYKKGFYPLTSGYDPTI